MVTLDAHEFGKRTGEGRPCGHYDFSLYYGLRFACACGEQHDFRPWMEIVCELPLFRFVVTCPDRCHMTVLKARWDRVQERRVLEPDFGAWLPEPRDSRQGVDFQRGLLEARTGRPWSQEETALIMEQGHGNTFAAGMLRGMKL